jgi:hypothetical protein
MELWRADVDIVIGSIEDDVDGPSSAVLFIPGVPVVHCGCDPKGEVHLFHPLTDGRTGSSLRRRKPDAAIILSMAGEDLGTDLSDRVVAIRPAGLRPEISA